MSQHRNKILKNQKIKFMENPHCFIEVFKHDCLDKTYNTELFNISILDFALETTKSIGAKVKPDVSTLGFFMCV